MTMHQYQQWRGSSGCIRNHIDPEREEHLRLMKLEVENQVKRILKLSNTINSGNKDRRLKKKSELLTLSEDFQKQYDSLYSLYEELREEVKQNFHITDGDHVDDEDDDPLSSSSSSSSSDSDTETCDNNPPHTSHSSNKKISNGNENEGSTTSTSTALPNPEESEVVLKELVMLPDEPEDKATSLERQVAAMKLEVSTLFLHKSKLREKLKSKKAEMKAKISSLQHKIMEIQAAFKDNHPDKNMQIELDTLKQHNSQLMEQLEALNSDRAEMEAKLRQMSDERADHMLQLEGLKNELKGTVEETKSIKSEIQSLSKTKRDLEEQVNKLKHEALKSNVDKDDLCKRISALQASISDREKQLLSEREKLNACQNSMIQKIDSLTDEITDLTNTKQKLEVELEIKNRELASKIKHQDKKMVELEDVITKLKEENRQAKTSLSQMCKSNFQFLERKMEETLEEFRKQFEDHYRILSRRISVAEQLQVEYKEWYCKTKEVYEQETRDLKERTETTESELRNMKDVAVVANDVVTTLDGVALQFETSTANFLSRISKSSCELKFAKQWAARKSKGLLQAQEEVDYLLSQLHDKEGEMLAMREKLWKLENKVRELEKMMEEKEDGMLVLTEEKREAIRQLCVWIDYHRGRSDYYKKLLSDKMSTGQKRPR
ncbi:COP1-interactive protein 1-like [Andrographis paniculata]|uniref:COP1-interactive protein 1-like n=1 Tax=Andrographis paniculata TaxID=175694 RepID=UPI0021E91D04|nr:COP1-interactive protein 1-like [Andrographis paniculata]XP_051151300.1 COP1-interactive protein 1-like [Andrographis paniculata]